MKTPKPPLQANSFLFSLIDSKLISHAKKTLIVPTKILSINMPYSMQTELNHYFPGAIIQNMDAAKLYKVNRLVKLDSIDMFIVNFTTLPDLDFKALLMAAHRILRLYGIFVFAVFNSASKSLLETYVKQLNQKKLIDEIEIASKLKQVDYFETISYKEHIISVLDGNEYIDCNIFILTKKKISANLENIKEDFNWFATVDSADDHSTTDKGEKSDNEGVLKKSK